MFKPSLTIHKSPSGAITVIACSEDADDAVRAYTKCNRAGEIQLILRGRLQKQKKVVQIKKAKNLKNL